MATKTVYRQLTSKRHTPRVRARRTTGGSGGFEQLMAKLGLASAMLEQTRARRR
jgi:hypothetical protein